MWSFQLRCWSTITPTNLTLSTLCATLFLKMTSLRASFFRANIIIRHLLTQPSLHPATSHPPPTYATFPPSSHISCATYLRNLPSIQPHLMHHLPTQPSLHPAISHAPPTYATFPPSSHISVYSEIHPMIKPLSAIHKRLVNAWFTQIWPILHRQKYNQR